MCLGFFGQFLSFFSIFYNILILLKVLNNMLSLGRVRKTESHMIWRNVNHWPRHTAVLKPKVTPSALLVNYK